METKKATSLGKRSIIGLGLGQLLGGILCVMPDGYF